MCGSEVGECVGVREYVGVRREKVAECVREGGSVCGSERERERVIE